MHNLVEDNMKGKIIIYTGNGQGKTTASLGMAMRAVAHGKKVVIIQFMKGRKNTGEYLLKDILPDNYEIHQFGRKEFVNLSNPSDIDKGLASEGLKFAWKKLEEQPYLMILDELNVAIKVGLVDIETVKKLILKRTEKTTLVITGRYASNDLIEMADIVTEMKELKRKRQYDATEGIEF